MMKRILLSALALTCLGASAQVMAQSAFDGTWKVDIKSITSSGPPVVFLLKNGTYWCKSCKPPYHIKADGTFHEVKTDSGPRMQAVKVIDDHTVMLTTKKDGKVSSTDTITVAPDGKTAKSIFGGTVNGHPVHGELTVTRVAKAPAGSNAISGSWQLHKVDAESANAITMTFRTHGNTLDFSSQDGESYSAELGGKPVPVKGDDSGETVSVAKVGSGQLRETYWNKGKIESVVTSTVAADGRHMHVNVDNRKTHRHSTSTMVKQ